MLRMPPGRHDARAAQHIPGPRGGGNVHAEHGVQGGSHGGVQVWVMWEIDSGRGMGYGEVWQ